MRFRLKIERPELNQSPSLLKRRGNERAEAEALILMKRNLCAGEFVADSPANIRAKLHVRSI